MSCWLAVARHHRAHRDPALACSGETVGDSSPGVSATACSTRSLGDVVVHHHVAAGDEHALQPALEHLEGRRGSARRLGVTSTASDCRIDSPKTSSPACAQRAAGLDDVGDHVGDAELDAVSTAPSSRTTSASTPRSAQVAGDQAGVRRRDALAGEIVQRRSSVPGRAANRKVERAEARAPAPPRPRRRSRAAGRGR